MECIAWSPTSTATKPHPDPDARYAERGNPLGMEDALCVRT